NSAARHAPAAADRRGRAPRSTRRTPASPPVRPRRRPTPPRRCPRRTRSRLSAGSPATSRASVGSSAMAVRSSGWPIALCPSPRAPRYRASRPFSCPANPNRYRPRSRRAVPPDRPAPSTTHVPPASERSRNVPQPRSLARRHEHRHHVEPHRPWRDPESAQPLTRRASDPRHLSRSDRFGRRAAAQTGPRLDLADDQRATVVADDVQLALATSPITREHGAPALLEVFRGQLFALPSQRSLTSRTFLD